MLHTNVPGIHRFPSIMNERGGEKVEEGERQIERKERALHERIVKKKENAYQ